MTHRRNDPSGHAAKKKVVEKPTKTMNVVLAADAIPPPPAHLRPLASQLWADLMPGLLERGRFLPCDTTALVNLCEAWQDFCDARTEIVASGLIVCGRSEEPKANPACVLKTKAGREMDSWCTHFLLSPMSRSKAGIVEAKKTESKMAKYDAPRG